MSKQTPLMRQYTQIKQKYPETVLLFRLGDFYETFGDDAKITAKVCGIALTKRNNGAGADMPLAGFPYHQLDNYLPKLVRGGYRVAVCEQLEDPKLARGIVKRDVIEVVTPGVAMYDKLLESNKNNYIASIYLSENRKRTDVVGFAAVDISTGEFITTEIALSGLIDLIEATSPAEILVSKSQKAFFDSHLQKLSSIPSISKVDEWFFDYDFARNLIVDFFESKNLKGFGIEDLSEGIIASGAVLNYIKDTQNGNISHLKTIRLHNHSKYMLLDAATRRNLEIAFSFSGSAEGALIKVLDRTSTPAGGRLLKRWFNSPLKDLEQINIRLNSVEEFFNKYELAESIKSVLKQTDDLERLSAKIASGRANPREVVAVKNTLKKMPELKDLLKDFAAAMLSNIYYGIDPIANLCELLDKALADEPSVQLGTGSVFKPGFNEELDEYINAKYSGKQWIADFQESEREKTGISSLKVGFNNVFGYYIEVTNVHKNKVPEYYDRKQTLTNAERYTTPELKQFEHKILSAEEKILDYEQKLFANIKLEVSQHLEQIQSNANFIAILDCLLSFAFISKEKNFSRPIIDDSESLDIVGGRHPIVEAHLPPGERFVPNSTKLNTTDNMVHIITGPNMSGKSCYLRQTALIVLMGQVGCFVPADKAKFGLVDRIFTRVGAQDNITSGESTFLVEMQEAANIINNATRRSLILLDEVGRGTATFDGISIAWSIAEHIHNELRAKTLFATHYHELNDMADRYSGIRNYKVEVIEADNKVVFSHKVSEGGSDHSFGIHVAQMAGLPKKVIDRASEIMQTFEGSGDDQSDKKPDIRRIKTRNKSQMGQQLSIFEVFDDKIRQRLKDISIENLTPIQALQILNELIDEVNKTK